MYLCIYVSMYLCIYVSMYVPLREIAVPHRTPEKEHRRPTDFPGKFPADASENHGKIFPKPSPEGPRDLQNRSGRPPEAPETIKIMKIVKKCKKVVYKLYSASTRDPFWRHLGPQAGPGGRPGEALGAPKVSQEAPKEETNRFLRVKKRRSQFTSFFCCFFVDFL